MLQFRLRTRLLRAGLDFSAIPSLPLEEIVQRTTWSQKEKDAWIAHKREIGKNALPVIISNILIEGTDIRAPQPQKAQALLRWPSRPM